MVKNIRWRIALPFAILTFIATGILTLYTSNILRQQYLDSLETRLTAEARLLVDECVPLFREGGSGFQIEEIAARWGQALDVRVTVIRSDGVVLGDSDQDPAEMDNHLWRPEIEAVSRGESGAVIRFSSTLGVDMMYVALPVLDGGEMAGFVRIAVPLSQITQQVSALRRSVTAVSLLIVLLAGVMAFVLAGNVSRPVVKITHMAERVASGDLSGRLIPTSQDEIGRLTAAFNVMADQLENRLNAVENQRNTLTTVLDRMADGVIIIDGEQHIQLINPAAARILSVTQQKAIGERFTTVARDHQVVEIWRHCCDLGKEQSEAVDVLGRGPFLHMVVTPLRDNACLVLFQDLTRIRRLETIRRDFISNISHELRTPLASLRALVETLQDGALDDPPAAQHFLRLMQDETDALAQMVEELLELSRIESGRVPLRLKPTPVEDLIRQPVERLRQQAQRADLVLSIDISTELPPVLADFERAGQIVTNLVHNAIKFTPGDGNVWVSAREQGDEVVIEVRDTGIGIPADDLPRIFERFYKADHARSGGGTGLGLAIARHLVEGHGGRIWAESIEGKGSAFFFTLRIADRRSVSVE